MDYLSNHFGIPAASAFARQVDRIQVSACPPKLLEAIQHSTQALAEIARCLPPPRERPLVSVIMPTHNRADILADSIATVVEQRYANWQLLVCDDASTDQTAEVVARFADPRIQYLPLPKMGAAAARNRGLARARGALMAYLDSDNHWHPDFLLAMVGTLLAQSGHSAIYADFIDLHTDAAHQISIKSFQRPLFDHERLLDSPFIDLNSFVHRRELYDCFGGFNEQLARRQDYDLILKYTWLRDPLHLPHPLTLYQRNDNLNQITRTRRFDTSCHTIINRAVESYFKIGLPLHRKPSIRTVTILSWDLCRNHFSKPFALAEALSADYDVQLISFRFFEEPIFPPLAGVNPPFETIYLPGGSFPDFFVSLEQALAAIRGDIIYVVKPRLPSLGLALLANHRHGIPIILEINDLETVVGSARASDRHREADLSTQDLDDPDLLNPYSDLWSQLMEPLARQLPVLVTHNRGIDAHFDHRCLYLRNLKDERVYDPAAYDRDAVRAELGYRPQDRVILFGGLLRKHKGIHELVELVERLADPRYRLLFVGSRPTPDQKHLIDRYGHRVRVLPPQDRAAMARINLAADLVILWLNPAVPASHYQMPYKATDAFAMGPAVIANDISDLGVLARQGYLRLVPFGDWEGMTGVIRDLFDQPAQTAAMRAASRRLFLRQFSYPAGRASFALAAQRALAARPQRLAVAATFAHYFDAFQRRLPRQTPAAASQPPPVLPAPIVDSAIRLLDVSALDQLHHDDPQGIAIVMPSIDPDRAQAAARRLIARAGMPATLFIVVDSRRQGFIRTLNQTAHRLHVGYLVYLAEDALPGDDWLRIAHATLSASGRGLLAFNDGKWRGRIAAFGLVRMSWAATLYGGPVFFPDYVSHKADNELTVLARAQDQFIDEPRAVLCEYDPAKPFADPSPTDTARFKARFRAGFDHLAPRERLAALAPEYRVSLDGSALPPLDPSRTDRQLFPQLVDPSQCIRIHGPGDPPDADPLPGGIAVILRATDPARSRETAELLARRAGHDCAILIHGDPVPLAAALCQRPDLRYLAVLDEWALPCLSWLHLARHRLDASDRSLLTFNDGHRSGAPARFLLARLDRLAPDAAARLLTASPPNAPQNALAATDLLLYDRARDPDLSPIPAAPIQNGGRASRPPEKNTGEQASCPPDGPDALPPTSMTPCLPDASGHDPDAVACNLCGGTRFLDRGVRPAAVCATCHSMERTRLLWMYAQRALKPDWRVLHIAPEVGLYQALAARLAPDRYETADINPKRYPFARNIRRLDLCTLAELPANHYDCIIHSHVFEHLPCPIAGVLRHLHRVLVPGGLHLCVIPFLPGHDDECFDDIGADERTRRFGQHDHVRRFGIADIDRGLGSLLRLDRHPDVTRDFSPETLRAANIPETAWRGFSIHTVLRLGKEDFIG